MQAYNAAHEVGSKVKDYRHLRGWSQYVLADRSGVSRASIANLERGKGSPKVETIAKLATALGVRIEMLVES